MMSSIDTCSKPWRLNMMRALSTIRARVFPCARPGRACGLRGAKVLDGVLADRRYLTGDTLTIADFCVGALLRHADKIELPLQPFQNIQRWHGRLMELEAWRDPWPRSENG
jgi:glutathione S-transferase